MNKYVWIFLVAVCLIVSCKGPVGPTGPQGPAGAQGLTGPAGKDFTYFTGLATVKSDGTAVVDLPIGAGTYSKPPLVTCLLGDGTGVWLVIGTDVSAGGATAGLVWASNHWRVVLIGGVPGWQFLVIAAW